MDGAAKFVRGDAIAGLLITVINLVGGLIIGVGQMGVSFAEAVHSYTLLTVGDGLVSQIPALVVSTAAGLLVAKAGVAERTDRALFGQLSAHPRALATTSGLLAVLAVLPGLPLLPFLLLSAASGGLAWHLGRRSDARAGAAEDAAAAVTAPAEEPISAALAMDPLRLELGYGLLPLIGEAGGPRLTDQIKALRRQLAGELGFVMPPVRIQDNIQLPANYLRGQAQGDRDRARRAAAQPAPGDGPQGRPDRPARRGDHRADLRPAGDVARREPARGGELPRLHGGRSGDRADHPSDRDHQGQSGRAADLSPRPRSCSTSCPRTIRS